MLLKALTGFLVLMMSFNTFANDADEYAVEFNHDPLDLDDLTSASTHGFVVRCWKNGKLKNNCNENHYVLTLEHNHILSRHGSDHYINYNTSIDKSHSTISITPDAFPSTQRAGQYTGNITLIISEH